MKDYYMDLELFSKRKKLMSYLNSEIEKLDSNIKDIKTQNEKNKRLKSRKKSLLILKYILPYIITSSIVLGALSSFQFNPFRKTYKKYLETKMIQDSLGNKTIEMKYGSYNNPSIINYYTKWVKTNTEYCRTVRTYSTFSLDADELKVMIELNDVKGIEYMLEKVLLEKTEIKNHIDIEEYNKGDYFEIITYDTVKDDYIYVVESSDKNWLDIFIWLISLIGLKQVLYNEYKRIKFMSKMSDLDSKYMEISTKQLEKVLSIKKETYEMMRGD